MSLTTRQQVVHVRFVLLSQCDNPYDTRFRPERLLLFDKHPGGIGLVAQVRAVAVVLQHALHSCVGTGGRSLQRGSWLAFIAQQ